MFILTAKVPKKRLLAGAITTLCCCLAVILALALTLGQRAVTTMAEVSGIRDNDDRVAYLTGLGWQVSSQPISTEELLIPDTFDESYTSYLALQAEQGFDLTQYCGKRVKRYVYQVTNHPSGEQGVQAALLIYRNRVVGGQVQSASGSFVHGLSMPQSSAAPQSGAPSASPALASPSPAPASVQPASPAL